MREMLLVMDIQTVIVAWVAISIALCPAVGAILRRQSRYYPPVR
jgi:hypothetical protein